MTFKPFRRPQQALWPLALLAFSLTACFALSNNAAAGESTPPGHARNSEADRLGKFVTDRSRTDRARLRAGRALAQSDDPGALAHLTRAIRDPDTRPPLRAALLSALARSPRRAEVSAFASACLKDSDENLELRIAAAHVLGAQGSANHLAVLVPYLDDPDPKLRQAARAASLSIGGPGVDGPALHIATLGDPDQPAATRAASARALGRSKDGRARAPLRVALGEEVKPVPEPKDLSDYYQQASEIKERIAIAAAHALGELGDPAAVPGLLEHAAHPVGEMRIAVYEALARIGSARAVAAARAALAADTEQRVRRWAAVLLKELKDPETIADLRRALEEDPDPGVRLQVVQGLVAMDDRESVDRIRAAAAREELREVRAAMDEAIRTLTAAVAGAP